jgi:hypothetical protein
VTVTVLVPVTAVAVAVKVSVLDVVADAGENVAVTPEGKALVLKLTEPVKPPVGAILMVLVPDPPCVTATVAGVAEIEKSGGGLCTTMLTVS